MDWKTDAFMKILFRQSKERRQTEEIRWMYSEEVLNAYLLSHKSEMLKRGATLILPAGEPDCWILAHYIDKNLPLVFYRGYTGKLVKGIEFHESIRHPTSKQLLPSELLTARLRYLMLFAPNLVPEKVREAWTVVHGSESE